MAGGYFRRPTRPPPPLAGQGEDVTVELEVRVRPGTETAAERELRDLGARDVERRGRGELRVAPSGPLRPLLAAECALAIYAVRPLPGTTLAWLATAEALQAAIELAAVVVNVGRKVKLRTFRLTAGPEVIGDRAAIGKLAGGLARRLGLVPAAVTPDLVMIVRKRADGLELAARLIRD